MIARTEENLFSVLWAGRRALVDTLVHGGETSLARVLGLMNTHQRRFELAAEVAPTDQGGEMLTGNTFYRPKVTDLTRHPAAILPDGRPLLNRTVIAGTCTVAPHHAPYDQVAVRTLLELTYSQAFDAIVELGSGMGQRLFELYLSGGPANIPYFAAELFASGRDIAERLAGLEPRLDFRSVAFDFKQPDLSFLAGFRRVLLFSNAALYCVQRLPVDFFTVLSSAAPSLTGVHFELLGHQTGSGLDPGSPHYAEAVRARRNEDFIPLLLEAERSGVITLDYLGPHAYSVSSAQPVTIAQWHARKGI